MDIPVQLHVADFLRPDFGFAIAARFGLLARSTQQSGLGFQPINILSVRSEKFLLSVQSFDESVRRSGVRGVNRLLELGNECVKDRGGCRITEERRVK